MSRYWKLPAGLAACPLVCFFLVACAEESASDRAPGVQTHEAAAAPAVAAGEYPVMNAYFGDLHVHTKYSFDSYIFGTRADPDDAYRFARGETLQHPAGMQMRLQTPLDFLAVTDHATYLGMFEEMDDPASAVGQHPLAVGLRNATTPEERDLIFRQILPRERGYIDEPDDLLNLDVVRSAWRTVVDAAERHNDPGRFTAFAGYEFTAGGRRGENLHRNVIFRGSNVPSIPFSRLDGQNNPERLWDWMDAQRQQGVESLAIPHNSNGSDGWMFELNNKAGAPIDAAYAEQRMRNEPLVEVTQVKGTSDTHPLLSPNDEWADFEIMEQTIGSGFPSKPQGSYVREAYLNGMLMHNAMQPELQVNPYRFGLIGSSDTHNAAGSFREDDYWSKTGLLDATPQQRGSVPLAESGEYADPVRRYWGASGLAGVWAQANTREAIFDAMRRKETFATTGPRMRVRFFAGYEITEAPLSDEQAMNGVYAQAVAMGGDLVSDDGGRVPRFLVWATRDPLTAPLDRLQVIKGWIEDGEAFERVFDVACSSSGLQDNGDGAPHRCQDNNATVDLNTCEISATTGAAELKTLWQDPDFDPAQQAFYYVRVLQNPTCRWSTWDALRAGQPPRPGLPATIQDRAWSSPIWYSP